MTAEVFEGPPLSIVTGDKDAALITQTIADRFDQAVKIYGDRNCVVVCDQGVRWTYSEFAGKVTDFAAGLLSLGLVPGDRVGIWAPNCAEWLITQYATAKAGLIQVNINPAYGQAELEYALNKVGCKALITAEQFKNSAYITMLQTLAPELNRAAPGNLQAAKLPALKTVIRLGNAQTPGFFNFAAIVARADDDLEAHASKE
jgi:fatty-acyl-CoA synthase